MIVKRAPAPDGLHRHLHHQLAVVAQSDIGCMGILGKEYGELTGAHVHDGLRGVAVECHVFRFIVLVARNFQVAHIGPADGLARLQRHLYVDKAAVSLQGGLVGRHQRDGLALDGDAGGDLYGCACLGIIVGIVAQPRKGNVEALRYGAVDEL